MNLESAKAPRRRRARPKKYRPLPVLASRSPPARLLRRTAARENPITPSRSAPIISPSLPRAALFSLFLRANPLLSFCSLSLLRTAARTVRAAPPSPRPNYGAAIRATLLISQSARADRKGGIGGTEEPRNFERRAVCSRRVRALANSLARAAQAARAAHIQCVL